MLIFQDIDTHYSYIQKEKGATFIRTDLLHLINIHRQIYIFISYMYIALNLMISQL